MSAVQKVDIKPPKTSAKKSLTRFFGKTMENLGFSTKTLGSINQVMETRGFGTNPTNLQGLVGQGIETSMDRSFDRLLLHRPYPRRPGLIFTKSQSSLYSRGGSREPGIALGSLLASHEELTFSFPHSLQTNSKAHEQITEVTAAIGLPFEGVRYFVFLRLSFSKIKVCSYIFIISLQLLSITAIRHDVPFSCV